MERNELIEELEKYQLNVPVFIQKGLAIYYLDTMDSLIEKLNKDSVIKVDDLEISKVGILEIGLKKKNFGLVLINLSEFES